MASVATLTVSAASASSSYTSQCFVQGTLVLTADEAIPIETVLAGMQVWAMNPETGEKALKKVVRTFVNESDELIHVHTGDDEIVCTPEHPFYVPTKGWTGAAQLRAGDILVLSNGSYVTVEKIQHEILESPVKVYNFEVEDFHTYFVGENSVLVHNRCEAKRYTPDQQAVIELAKENKKGISPTESNILVDWAKEYGIKSHYAQKHLNRSGYWSNKKAGVYHSYMGRTLVFYPHIRSYHYSWLCC